MLHLNTKRWITTLAVLTLTFGLNGCGFKLRSAHSMPAELKEMQLHSVDKYSELSRLLQIQFSLNEIKLIQNEQLKNKSLTVNENTVFKLYRDKLDRRTLSLFPNGQVAEYGLIYSVKYSVTLPAKAPRTFDFEIYRDYQGDPENALAKSKELKLILKEMRQQAANKIIQQLASFDQSDLL